MTRKPILSQGLQTFLIFAVSVCVLAYMDEGFRYALAVPFYLAWSFPVVTIFTILIAVIGIGLYSSSRV